MDDYYYGYCAFIVIFIVIGSFIVTSIVGDDFMTFITWMMLCIATTILFLTNPSDQLRDEAWVMYPVGFWYDSL